MAVPEVARADARRQTLFFAGSALVLGAIVAIGFSRSFYLRSAMGTVGPNLPSYLVMHGITLTTWYLILIAQTLLVVTGRRGLHRQLGTAGVVVAVAVVVTSLIVMRSVVAARVAVDGAEVPAGLAFVIVSDFWLLIAFSLLVVAAVHWRRRPETHKRLMLIASAFLVGPAFSVTRPVGQALVPFLPNGLLPSRVFVVLALAALIGYDLRTRKRIESATLAGAAVVAVALVLTRLMSLGDTGPAFARWLAGLPAGE